MISSNMQSSLPFDIALKIASSLQVTDVCALGSCCRFWRELCGSDSLWESLTRQRWPSLPLLHASSSSEDPVLRGWRGLYMRMHREMAGRAASVVEFVDRCSPSSDSIEVGDYFKAVLELISMQLGFGDVRFFLFNPKLNVLHNLVALHYCIFCLKLPADLVVDALESCKISERRVCVKWWKIGRWFYGFRMRDESHSRWVSLADLTTSKGEEVLGILRRGAIHEVLRVEISTGNAAPTPWTCQSAQIQD